MKKINYFTISVVLFLLLISSVFLLGENNVFDPDAIQPKLMNAAGKLFDIYLFPEDFFFEGSSAGFSWLGQDVDPAGATFLGHVNITIEFLNVGAQGNSIYNVVEQKEYFQQLGLDPTTMYYGFGTVKFKTVYEGEQFSGCEIYNSFGYELGSFSGGPQGVIEPDWTSNSKYKEQWPLVNGNYIVIGFKGNDALAPPADAEIPIADYKAFFNEQSISEPDEAEPEKESGKAEEKQEAPTIELILKGPFESGGSKNSFIVEAVVTGSPEPTVQFSRDDSGGSLGKYKALINLGPDSWITVEATAANSAGTATDQVNISTKLQIPTINLKIVQELYWLTYNLGYYIVKAEVTGFPEPSVVWKRKDVKGRLWPAGKNKQYVYVSKDLNENTTLTAYAKNSEGKSASKSITLSWADPPKEFYSKNKLLLLKDVYSKGKVFIKRADSSKWQEVNTILNIYEGDMIKTGNDKAAIVSSTLPLAGFIKPNTIFMVTKNGDVIEQGSMRIKTGNKYKIKSKYGDAEVKGTDFILSADENKTTLQVIEGTVDFYSNVTGDMAAVNSGESIDATEKGLGAKGTFNVEEEEKYWEDLTEDTDSQGLSSDSAQEIPTYGMVLIMVLIFLLCIVLGTIIFFLKKYKYF